MKLVSSDCRIDGCNQLRNDTLTMYMVQCREPLYTMAHVWYSFGISTLIAICNSIWFCRTAIDRLAFQMETCINSVAYHRKFDRIRFHFIPTNCATFPNIFNQQQGVLILIKIRYIVCEKTKKRYDLLPWDVDPDQTLTWLNTNKHFNYAYGWLPIYMCVCESIASHMGKHAKEIDKIKKNGKTRNNQEEWMQVSAWWSDRMERSDEKRNGMKWTHSKEISVLDGHDHDDDINEAIRENGASWTRDKRTTFHMKMVETVVYIRWPSILYGNRWCRKMVQVLNLSLHWRCMFARHKTSL